MLEGIKLYAALIACALAIAVLFVFGVGQASQSAYLDGYNHGKALAMHAAYQEGYDRGYASAEYDLKA